MTDLTKFIQKLREDPSMLSRDPAQVATQFHVDEGLVRLAMTRIRSVESVPEGPTIQHATKTSKPRVRPFAWAEAPLGRILPWFLAAIASLAIVAKWIDPFAASLALSAAFLGFLVFSAIVTWVQPTTRTAMIMGIVPCLSYVAGIEVSGQTEVSGAVVLMTAMMLWILAVGLLIIVSVVSGWVSVKSEQRDFDRMPRQEQLARFLYIRGVLEDSGTAPEPKPVQSVFEQMLSRHPFLITAGLALTVSIFASIVYKFGSAGKLIADPSKLSSAAPTDILAFTGLWLATVAIALWAQLKIANNAKTWYHAAAQAVLYQLISNAVTLSPLGSAATREALQRPGVFISSFIQTSIIFLIGYSYARLKARIVEKKRRQELEPSALMAELLELEFRLRPTAVPITVLAVDVVGSTTMKAEADPYEIEWTFREYQSVVRRAATSCGGEVISTAGDGTILSFVTCQDAYDGATEIYKAVDEFNANTNRLEKPFELRMGLHFGEVKGNLGEVQFTSVIDIAAHMERASPIGGIAISGSAIPSIVVRQTAEVGPAVDGEETVLVRSLVPTRTVIENRTFEPAG